jgi:hypothetical protein
VAGLVLPAVLLRSACSSAGDTAATGATAGHSPTTLASTRQPRPPSASTMGMTCGLAARCGDSGTRAVQAAPFQACVHLPAVSITSPVSGKNCSVLPRRATGSPCTVMASASPSTRAVLSGMMPRVPASTGWGCAAKAASNAAVCSAVLPRAAILSTNSPSSGMHSFLHTSHCALSLTSRSPNSDGLNCGVTVSGTGSSTVPS